MRVANYFEDDYGNIEIVPAENEKWCADQQREIDRFSEAHRSGIGWTDVYLRSAVPVPLASRNIRFADLDKAITLHLQRFDQITYEGRPVSATSQTVAYGPDAQVVVFVELNGEHVKELWATFHPVDGSHVAAVVAGLGALATYNLVLVDWGWSRVIPLADTAQLHEYMSERLKVFAQIEEQASRSHPNWLARLQAWFAGGA